MTNDKGEYTLEAYEGAYTIKVAAPGYYSDEFSVELKGDVTKETALKPFVGYPGEIAYDDGTAENANSYFAAGNGWAVKMTLADGKDKGSLQEGCLDSGIQSSQIRAAQSLRLRYTMPQEKTEHRARKLPGHLTLKLFAMASGLR